MKTKSPATLLKTLEKNYSPREEMPLGTYAALTAVFSTLLLVAVNDARKRNDKTSLDDREVILGGIAAHKLARLITKDAVTSFLRAPLLRYQEDLGYGELNEEPRVTGPMEAVAELINCTFCMSAWTGLAMFAGLTRLPGPTRLITRFLTMVTISDFLHVLYEERRTQSNVLTLEEEKLDRKEKSAKKAS